MILYGAVPAAEIPGSFDAFEDMPGLKEKISDRDLQTLVNFLRVGWNNRGARVDSGFIADQR